MADGAPRLRPGPSSRVLKAKARGGPAPGSTRPALPEGAELRAQLQPSCLARACLAACPAGHSLLPQGRRLRRPGRLFCGSRGFQGRLRGLRSVGPRRSRARPRGADGPRPAGVAAAPADGRTGPTLWLGSAQGMPSNITGLETCFLPEKAVKAPVLLPRRDWESAHGR